MESVIIHRRLKFPLLIFTSIVRNRENAKRSLNFDITQKLNTIQLLLLSFNRSLSF